MMNSFYKFDDNEKLLEKLVLEITNILEKSILEKGFASLLVSGGNTPKKLFDKLSNINISWENVKIGLCDERWIDTGLEDSNEFLVKNYLLKNFAQKAKFIGMYIPKIDLEKAEEKCSEIYKNELYPFDAIILGMGNDAHTASLFPNNEKLEEAFDLNNEKLCISITPKTAPYDRMSLNLKAILSAKNIFLHIEGRQKLEVYEKALKSDDKYTMPIVSILKQDIKEIEVFYYE